MFETDLSDQERLEQVIQFYRNRLEDYPKAQEYLLDRCLNDPDLMKTFEIGYADRRYRIRGLEKNLSFDRLKVNLLVARDDLTHINTFDLYNARMRKSFIKESASTRQRVGAVFITTQANADG